MKYFFFLICITTLALFSCNKKEPKKSTEPYNYTYTIEELRQFSDEHLKNAGKELEDMYRVISDGKYKVSYESLAEHNTPEWYKDAKLGIFFDWGVYSIAGYGEKGWSKARYPDWYLGNMSRQYKEYHDSVWGEDFKRDDFIGLFNAETFDAKEIIQLAVSAGAKYFVPFSKHHDGFCLWDSKFTQRDVVDMNPGRDLTREMVDACEKAGLYHGFYFSVEDYEYPIISKNNELKLRYWSKDMAPDNAGVVISENEVLTDFVPDLHNKLISGKIPVHNFIDDYIVPQAKDFIDKYDPDILWFDGEWQRPAEYYKTLDIVAYFYNHAEGRKEVAANDRWGQGSREHGGDFYTSETDEVVEKISETWEENRSMSESYGYNKRDSLENYLSPDELVEMLVRIVAKGGNLNLIVNPDGNGGVSKLQLDLLEELGNWLEVNGEAIYGSRPYEALCDNTQLGQTVWYTSSKDNKYGYAIILDWPKSETFICSKANIKWESDVYLLGWDEPLRWVDRGKRFGVSAKIPEAMLHNPEARPSKYAWVLKFEHDVNDEF